MKKKELINIIERLVRKEVKKQVNEIFISEGKKGSGIVPFKMMKSHPLTQL